MRGHTKDGYFKLMKCEYCNQKGHVKDTCYKLIGYPTNFKAKKRSPAGSGYMVQRESDSIMSGMLMVMVGIWESQAIVCQQHH